jgi:hypothetical protein
LVLGLCGVSVIAFLDSLTAHTRKNELMAILDLEQLNQDFSRPSVEYQNGGIAGRRWLEKFHPELDDKNTQVREMLRLTIERHGESIYHEYELSSKENAERFSAILLPMSGGQRNTLAQRHPRLWDGYRERREPTINDLVNRFDLLIKPRTLFVAVAVVGQIPPIPHRPTLSGDNKHSNPTIKEVKPLAPTPHSRDRTPQPATEPRNNQIPIPIPVFKHSDSNERLPFLDNYQLQYSEPNSGTAGEGVIVLQFAIGKKNSSGQALQYEYKYVEVPVRYETVAGVSAAEFQGVATPALQLLGLNRQTIDSLILSYGDLPVSSAKTLVTTRALDSLQRVTVLGLTISRRILPIAILLLQALVLAGILKTATDTRARRLDVLGGVETDSAFELLLGSRARLVVWVILPVLAVGLAHPPFALSWAEYALVGGGALTLFCLGLTAYRRSKIGTVASSSCAM